MRLPSLFAIGLALLVVSGSASQADASPMTLSITGTAFGVSVNDTMDVSSGFPGISQNLTNFPVQSVYGTIPEGGSQAINSTIDLRATLSSASQTLATLTLDGPIQGSLSFPAGGVDINGSVQGSVIARSLFLSPTVDGTPVPSWFSGLGATVLGSVTGGTDNLLSSSLSITPGASGPSGPQPVPEPTTLTLFGLAIVGFGARHLAIRGRKGSGILER